MNRVTTIARKFAFAVALAPISCAPLPQFPFAAHADLAPPRVLRIGFASSTELVLGFDESCDVVPGSVSAGSSLEGSLVQVSYSGAPLVLDGIGETPPTDTEVSQVSHEIHFLFSSPPDPGTEHHLEG